MNLPEYKRGRHLVDRTCIVCGVQFQAVIRRGRGLFCGKSCHGSYAAKKRNELYPQAGAGNNNWKGGVSKHPVRYTKRFIAKFPEKRRAQVLVTAALKSGLMVRPEFCSKCRKACKAHAHHDDYTKPYDVRWLCQQCHNAHHAELRRQQKRTAA